MKKNKHIGNIEKEKLKLRVKQLELEKQIRRDWNELKSGLLIRNFFPKTRSTHHTKPGLLTDAFTHCINYLTNRASEIAGQKIESGMRKSIDKLAEKLKTLFNK